MNGLVGRAQVSCGHHEEILSFVENNAILRTLEEHGLVVLFKEKY
jgi:hypothetical protein